MEQKKNRKRKNDNNLYPYVPHTGGMGVALPLATASALLVVLNRLRVSDLNIRGAATSSGGLIVALDLLNLGSHCHEGLLYIGGVLCTGF